MANLGVRDTSTLVQLTGWDNDRIKEFDLANKTDYMSVVSLLGASLGALNAEINNHPVWSNMVSVTDRPEVNYRVGSSNGFEDHTEYGRPDAKRAAQEGHMLPIRAYDRMLGWTWDYLQEARMDQIEDDIADALKDARDIFRQKLLTRILKRGDESGVVNGLGSSGLSCGFATTAASTGVDFIPPSVDGTDFASTHEHYVGITGGLYTNAVFSDAYDELVEHGHQPPFEFWIGKDDQATVEGLTKFTKVAENLVAYGANQDVALLNGAIVAGSYYIGTIHNFKVRVVPGIPQYYGFGFKSYGANSQRNPVRIRVPKGLSSVQFIAMPEPNSGSGIVPVQNLMLYAKFGVGVSDRTNGTARYVNSATWTDGTAT